MRRLQNMTVQAALQAADQMLEGMEGSHTVLRVIIDNMLYPITVDILKQVSPASWWCSQFTSY